MKKRVIIPIGWTSASLEEVCYKIQDGTHFSPKKQYIKKKSDYYLYITSKNIRNDGIDLSRITYLDEKTHREIYQRCDPKQGDVLLVKDGVNTGNVTINTIKKEFSLLSSVAFLRPVKEILSPEYLSFYFQSPVGFEMVTGQMTGSAIKRIVLRRLRKSIIYFPPLNEQRRIVAKIEELTDRTKKAREALADVPELIEQFRRSVLAAAFRGDLTADWREQNEVKEKWKEISLGRIIYGKPRNGYSPKAVDFPTSVKSLTLSATTSGTFKPEHFKYLDEEIESGSYLWLIPGDILIQRSNTLDYVGTSAVYTSGYKEFIYPDLMIKIQVKKDIAEPEFINFQISSERVRKYFKASATGTAGNMPKINQKIVMNTSIFLPSINE